MPAAPGESLLSTLYADIHYFFRAPTASQPQNHRFDKGSYVYLYHSASSRQTKIEIANHAGTPDQDAFQGYFSAVQQIAYTHKHPTLVTIKIDQAQVTTPAEWHLPTWDDRNEKRWKQKLHSLDLYFWTERDASTFVRHIKTVTSPEKLNVSELNPARQAVHSEHRDSMSPVVQQLEKTAIGAQFPPRAGSTTSAQSLPGPPTPATTNSAVSPPPQQQQQQQQQQAPMAYNPAAPAAPEPIAHREKTPPPPDDGTGTGLASAARYDAMPSQHHPSVSQQYAQYAQHPGSSLQNTPQSSYFPGPPQAAAGASSSPSNLPPPPSQPASTPVHYQPQQQQHSFGPQSTAPATQYVNYQPTPGHAPSVNSPGIYGQQPPTPSAPPAYTGYAPLASPGFPPPPPGKAPASSPAPAPAPAPPQAQPAQVAGFSSYSYASPQQAQPAAGHYNPNGAFMGDVHNQVYRPTGEEAKYGHHKPRPQQPESQSSQGSLDNKYRITERVGKVEKGIGGFLKKLDQKF